MLDKVAEINENLKSVQATVEAFWLESEFFDEWHLLIRWRGLTIRNFTIDTTWHDFLLCVHGMEAAYKKGVNAGINAFAECEKQQLEMRKNKVKDEMNV